MSDCSCCNSAPKVRERGGEQEGNILSYSLSSENKREASQTLIHEMLLTPA